MAAVGVAKAVTRGRSVVASVGKGGQPCNIAYRQRHQLGRRHGCLTRFACAAAATTTEEERMAISAAETVILAIKALAPRPSGEEEQAIENAIAVLEAASTEADFIKDPAIEGEWELVFVSKSTFSLADPLGRRVDGSAPVLEAIFRAASKVTGDDAPSLSDASSSPIQRLVTGFTGVKVTQFVDLGIANPTPERNDPASRRCDQRVFAFDGNLTLELKARADPEPPFRIGFTFEEGVIGFKTPFGGHFTIPYPVPFKLLGEEAKGWLDQTYLSDRVRISKGNKGSTFVLVKRTN